MSVLKQELSGTKETPLAAVDAEIIDLDAFMKPVQIQQECGWCDGRGYDPLDPDGEPCRECGGLKYELVTRHYLREALAIVHNTAHQHVPERKHHEALLSFARATVAAAQSGELSGRYGRALERIVRMERGREHSSAGIDSFRRAKAIAQSALLKTEVAR
jgi:hypothetical protein